MLIRERALLRNKEGEGQGGGGEGQADPAKQGGETQGGTEQDAGYWRSQFEATQAQLGDITKRFTDLEKNHNTTREQLKNTKAKHKETPEGKEDFENHVRQEYENQYSGKLAEANDTISSLTKRVRGLTITNEAKSLAAKYFNDDLIDLVVSEVERQADLEGDRTVIKDGSGTIRKSSVHRGQDMSLDELFQELTKKYPSGTKAKIRSGGMHGVEKASSNGQGEGAVQLPAGFGSWSQKDQQDYFAKNKAARKEFLNNYSREA